MFSAGAEVDVLPVLPVPALEPAHRNASPSAKISPTQDSYGDLPRSASYDNFPGAQELPQSEGIKRTFSDDVLARRSYEAAESGQPPIAPSRGVGREKLQSGKQEVAITRFTLSDDDLQGTAGRGAENQLAPEVIHQPKPSSGRSVSNTFRNLARRSWKQPSSRSPSPSIRNVGTQGKSQNVSPIKRQSTSVISKPDDTLPVSSSGSMFRSSKMEDLELSAGLSKRPTIRQRISGHDRAGIRPLSAIIPTTQSETEHGLSRMPSLRSLRSKTSSDKLAKLPTTKVPSIPSALSSERLSSFSVDVNKKKDPLWGAFRTLDGDFQKFQSKSSALKANVIRTCLLPFLNKHVNHPSNGTMRSEDLDRRVTILNKWWLGLLEMLNGRNNQSISGTDRPIFLDGVAGIMLRPEWRIPTYLNPRSADTPSAQRSGMPTSTSTTSLDSGGSDFLTDSIHHNVRNIFVQNLLSQMAFVVDKMSMRSAPASLVTFCGKVCAYAFFFCPGVADILVRLWRLSADSIRRVLIEFGLPRGVKFGSDSVEVASHFPPAMRGLTVTSHAALIKRLRHRMPLPLGAGYIRWHGPWIGRWNGRDSDLFFSFIKHFHLLVAETLPASFERKTRVCVPGLVPVHAQILAFLESTLYRQPAKHSNESNASGALDDIDSPDATVTMPLTTANAARSMAENRLIMLLRDVLAENSPDHQGLRLLYAEAFGDLLKAAARKIPIFDHDACFVLCDYFEEVLPIISRYHQSNPGTIILDWGFWLGVYRSMMNSEHTLTEVRLLAFIYSTWNILIANRDRRRELCLDWLLTPSFFEKFFNHWCPMVRAYFLRLLCWRVVRYDGEATELDGAIFGAMADRLDSSWASYLYLKHEAEVQGHALPSSAPCSPAPGRRLVIIRNDNPPLPVSMFTSFDSVLSQMSSARTVDTSISSSTSVGSDATGRATPKKKWSFIKNILPFSTPVNLRPGEVTPPGSADSASTLSEGDGSTSSTTLSASNNVSGASEEASNEVSPMQRPSNPTHQPFSFKFSLEWLDGPSLPTKNRRLSRPRLPQAAQTVLQARSEERRRDEGDFATQKPAGGELDSARYCGRALAEWGQIVAEYQAFVDRRKEEGVPVDRLVETPSLGVESFRMSG